MRNSVVVGDIKSLLVLFGLVFLAVLSGLCLIAAVGMTSSTLSGQFIEVAPSLALVYGMLAFIFGALFVGLLYHQVRFLRGQGPEPKA